MPRAHEMMSEPKTLASGFSYIARGKLSRLPKGHQIWLLTKDENTGRVWPQSFEDPRYDEETKMWEVRVNGSRKSRLAIIAVVAAPSTQDYFRYFQRLGELSPPDFVGTAGPLAVARHSAAIREFGVLDETQ
jgi:hypothetical protein